MQEFATVIEDFIHVPLAHCKKALDEPLMQTLKLEVVKLTVG